MHTHETATADTRRTFGVIAVGLASAWLVYPLVAGPLALLRDFWSWAVLCIGVLVCLRQRSPETMLLPVLAWSLLLAALANAGQGLVQAYQLWRHTGISDVYGLMHQRNQLATLCLMGLAGAGWVHAQGKAGLVRPAALVLGSVVSLSASRTGLLGLLLLWGSSEALAVAGGNNSAKALRAILRWALLGYALALLPGLVNGTSPVGILARQDTQEGVSVCTSRLSLWANVLQLIGQKPWIGWGWGELDYAHFITLFQGERFCDLLSNAHNLPLHLAVELGIPAAVLFCGLVLLGVWRGRPWREHSADRLLAWAVLGSVAMHSLLEYPLWYGPFQVNAQLCLWVLLRTPRQSAPGPALARGPWSRTAVRGLQWAAGVGLLCTVLVAADYYRASQIYLQPPQRLGGYREATHQQIQNALFFQNQIDFAKLGLTEVTVDNAESLHALALKMLHFSPEAMVVQKLLDSTRLLGRQDEYDFYQPRFAAAYPDAFFQWKASQPGE